MYTNRVKNDRKIFEIPAFLSSERGKNPERENSKIIYIILNFPTMDFLVRKIKEREFSKKISVVLYPVFLYTLVIIFGQL